MDNSSEIVIQREKDDIASSPSSFIVHSKLVLASKNFILKSLSKQKLVLASTKFCFEKSFAPPFISKKKRKEKNEARIKMWLLSGTTRRNTRCRGTSRGTEVDSCGIGTATTPTAIRDPPCDSHPPPRSRRGSASVSSTRRTRRAARFPAFFGSPTRHAWWESFRSTRGPGRGRRRNRRPTLFNNLNRPSLRLIER